MDSAAVTERQQCQTGQRRPTTVPEHNERAPLRCELAICHDSESLSEASNALVTLHRERWASKGESGGFASDAYEAFHREIIKRFFMRDQLWLVTLKLDGAIIGVQYIFAWRQQLLFFQSGYSPEHEKLSPGHVMFTWVIAQAIERNRIRIDLLKGDYAYKSVYALDVCITGSRLFVRRSLNEIIARCRQRVKHSLHLLRKAS